MNKSKKLLLISTLLVLLACISTLLVKKIQHKNSIASNIRIVPSFTFETLKGGSFTNDNLVQKPLLFMFFSTDCDYCHYETRELKKHINEFSKFQVCLVSNDSRKQVQDFADVYELEKYPQLNVLLDTAHKAFDYFGVSGVPAVYVYNADKKLVKKFHGEVKMEALIAAIN